MSRRGFLKILGSAAVVATVAAPLFASSAPLFVPAQNLDMGVPRRILTATEMPTLPARALLDAQDAAQAATRMAGAVPMMLLYDEFLLEWGGRLKAGSTLLVDAATAERWERRRIAVRPDGSTPQRVLPGRDARRAGGSVSPEAWKTLTRRPMQGRV